MNNNQIYHTCGICEQQKRNGFFLYQLYICQECEQEIVAVQPHEEAYHTYVQKLRAINQSTYTI